MGGLTEKLLQPHLDSWRIAGVIDRGSVAEGRCEARRHQCIEAGLTGPSEAALLLGQ